MAANWDSTMTNVASSETPAQKRAADRADRDMQIATEGARATTQAAILINGGAATAILAYLSKSTPTAPSLLHAASWALAIYAFGVLCALLSMWFSAQAAAQFAHYREAMLDE